MSRLQNWLANQFVGVLLDFSSTVEVRNHTLWWCIVLCEFDSFSVHGQPHTNCIIMFEVVD